jgi:hypothetical protein
MFQGDIKITNKSHIGERVKILTWRYAGEIGEIIAVQRWGASWLAVVRIGNIPARYGCGPGLPIRLHTRPFRELERVEDG